MIDILLVVTCMLWVYCLTLETRIARIEKEFMVDK